MLAIVKQSDLGPHRLSKRLQKHSSKGQNQVKNLVSRTMRKRVYTIVLVTKKLGTLVSPELVFVISECVSFKLVTPKVRAFHIYTESESKPNRTVTATELHRFVFGRPFTYESNPWTKSKKMPV